MRAARRQAEAARTRQHPGRGSRRVARSARWFHSQRRHLSQKGEVRLRPAEDAELVEAIAEPNVGVTIPPEESFARLEGIAVLWSFARGSGRGPPRRSSTPMTLPGTAPTARVTVVGPVIESRQIACSSVRVSGTHAGHAPTSSVRRWSWSGPAVVKAFASFRCGRPNPRNDAAMKKE